MKSSYFEDMLDRISNKLESRVNAYALLLTLIDETMIKYANSQPSVTQSWNMYELGLYLIKDKKAFVAGLRNPNEEDLDVFIENSLKKLEKIRETELLPEFPSTKTHDALPSLDKKVIDAQSNLGKLMELVSSRTRNETEIAGMISLGKREIMLRTSTGFTGKHANTFFNGYFRIFRGERSGQWAFSSTFYDEGLVEKTLDNAEFYASLKLPYLKPEEGEYTVILSPMVAGNLFSLLAYMSNAFAIQNGLSFLKPSDLEKEITTNELSLYDDPRNIELPFNTPFDAEGVSTYNKPIIEKGVLKNILHNTATARLFGARSTGNAGWIEPTPWNLEIKEGDASLEEMIKDTKKGVLLNNNWYTRFQNYTTGEFSTVARDAIILIENGEFKGLLRKARISSSYPQLLRNIRTIGKERYKIKWWEVENPFILPYVVIDNVRVTIPDFPS
jgi:PmbA protein